MIKHLREQQARLEVEAEAAAVLRIKQTRLEETLKSLNNDLKEAKKSHSPVSIWVTPQKQYQIDAIYWDPIASDRSGYQINSYLISPQKHVLWIFIKCFRKTLLKSTQNMFSWISKKNINTYFFKKKKKLCIWSYGMGTLIPYHTCIYPKIPASLFHCLLMYLKFAISCSILSGSSLSK